MRIMRRGMGRSVDRHELASMMTSSTVGSTCRVRRPRGIRHNESDDTRSSTRDVDPGVLLIHRKRKSRSSTEFAGEPNIQCHSRARRESGSRLSERGSKAAEKSQLTAASATKSLTQPLKAQTGHPAHAARDPRREDCQDAATDARRLVPILDKSKYAGVTLSLRNSTSVS